MGWGAYVIHSFENLQFHGRLGRGADGWFSKYLGRKKWFRESTPFDLTDLLFAREHLNPDMRHAKCQNQSTTTQEDNLPSNTPHISHCKYDISPSSSPCLCRYCWYVIDIAMQFELPVVSHLILRMIQLVRHPTTVV